ncbi:MAG: hypothetical protein ABIP74_01390 [Candidatus Saccharimonas sp.]
MDFLKSHKRRTRVSEVAYIILNVAFAIALLVTALLIQSPWISLLIVVVSKWRALAVRPRFWFANLTANMVDITVGISVVGLLYAAAGAFWLQCIITALYIGWLLFIKPRSKRSYVATQAGFAVFLGITALSIVSFSWDSFFFVGTMWLLGYAASRHVLGSYDEPHTTLYSLITAFVFAELGWISFHWLIGYPLPGFGTIQLSQLALLTTLFCLIAERAYASYHTHGKVRWSDIMMPVFLTLGLMAVLFILALIHGAETL